MAPSKKSPVRLTEWLRSAAPPSLEPNRVSLENGIDLAWRIAIRLLKLVEAHPEGAGIGAGLQASENILLFVESSPSTLQSDANRTLPRVADIQFQFELGGGSRAHSHNTDETSATTNDRCDQARDNHNRTTSQAERELQRCSLQPKQLAGRDDYFGSGSDSSCHSRDMAVALGMILMDIFFGIRSARDAGASIDKTALGGAPLERAKKRQENMTSGVNGVHSGIDLLQNRGLPVSINRLVCDLLNGALVSLEEVVMDLSHMKNNPESFLFDQTCPQIALKHTGLFGNDTKAEETLFGRENEIDKLRATRNRVQTSLKEVGECCKFVWEATFLSGYEGSGKSKLIQTVVRSCNKEGWFIIACKFDKHVSPEKLLAKAFDNWFGKYWCLLNDGDEGANSDPSSRSKEFQETNVCKGPSIFQQVFATVVDDSHAFHQLCELVPNFAHFCPKQANGCPDQDGMISSSDSFGSGQKKVQHLFSILLKSLCSVGVPVLLVLDDLHWIEKALTEGLFDIISDISSSSLGNVGSTGGLFLLGAYRSNEVQDDLIERIDSLRQSKIANVTTLTVEDLSAVDINDLLSAKMCLPKRYTRQLAELVHTKTRGNAYFVTQFLRTIIQNKMLSYSVKGRRWEWDVDVVEMQMISADVAGLLTHTFNKLPLQLQKTMEIVSCLGYQVEDSIIEALNSAKTLVPFDMLIEMDLAVKEGLLEKAGPMWQFTHDILQQTIYHLTPTDERKLLHKTLGIHLHKAANGNPAIHLMAADQSKFVKRDNLSPEECTLFAECNATAAKFAAASSNFRQTRSYLDMGRRMLTSNHWDTQYALSLDIFERCASVSYMIGDMEAMSSCLDEILNHAKSFDDSLTARILQVKLLASSTKFEDAVENCLIILQNLGEELPRGEFNFSTVQDMLESALPVLNDIADNPDQIKQLTLMRDCRKLNAMRVMAILRKVSFRSHPKLLPFLGWRMVSITLEYGFCDESIIGLVVTGFFSLFLFTDHEHAQLGYRIGKVGGALIEENPRKHLLLSQLALELCTLKMSIEPVQSVIAVLPEHYNSAMISGDVDSAMVIGLSCCIANFYLGLSDLNAASRHFVSIMKETKKYQQNYHYHQAMAFLNPCLYLANVSFPGNFDAKEIELKSFDALEQMANKTNNTQLLFECFLGRITELFWMRKYKDVALLCQQFRQPQGFRNLDVFRYFYEGIAALTLARETSGEESHKWRKKGIACVSHMTYMAKRSTWNYGHRAYLLQAEMQFTAGFIALAESTYIEGVKAAHEHKFQHEEYLACELYGIFCVENQKPEKGLEQLTLALNGYRKWGAIRKVNELQRYIIEIQSNRSNEQPYV